MEFNDKVKAGILRQIVNSEMLNCNYEDILQIDITSFDYDVKYSLKQLEQIQSELDYKLSDNQLLFIHAAENNGFEISYDYSGRGMFGKQCPSIIGDDADITKFNGVSVKTDSMDYDTVIYAQY